MIETAARIEFLKKSHLFLGLSEAELTAVASELEEKFVDVDEQVFQEEAPAEYLAIIYKGKVGFTQIVKGKTIKMHAMVKGDYFGEQGLVHGNVRDRTATGAENGTLLLILSRKSYNRLLKTAPSLRHNIEVMISSRQLALQLNYAWLNENEIIFFLARKHRFLLVQTLILPVVLLAPVFGLLVLAFMFESATFGLLGGFSLVAVLAWGAWRGLDWGNDYYIVTNQRVIWLEKVIAFYDSRTEAGMGTILSVTTDTDLYGRMFDYGTVVVRTYTGQIRLRYIRHPKQAAALIEELLNRTKEEGKRATEESMKQAIRAKLGLNKPPIPPAPAKPAKPGKKPNPFEAWWKNAFRMRSEDGNIITYRKHIFGFFRDAFPFAFGILALCGMVIAWPYLPLTQGGGVPLWFGTIIVTGVLVLFGRIIYEYLDWENDIYQVTPDQIIDISRKPFGTEDRRVALLENILSTEYKRSGLIGILLNFGTVYVMVGTEAYNFEDVADPPSVQQDIIRRQMGSKQKKTDATATAEQNRMAEWLAMYHRTLDDYNQGKDGPPPPKPG